MTAFTRLMRHEVTVGAWYRMPTGDKFEVVAMDCSTSSIDVQFYDGTVDELCLDECLLHGMQPSSEPMDWRGALENDISQPPPTIDLHTDNWCDPKIDRDCIAVGTNLSDDCFGFANVYLDNPQALSLEAVMA